VEIGDDRDAENIGEQMLDVGITAIRDGFNNPRIGGVIAAPQ
jgi:hypothetical protein